MVVYSLGVIPLLSTCPDPVPSFSRARDQQRVIRAAQKSRGDALNRAEAGRAAPSGAERSRAPGSSGAEGPAAAATHASSTTSPERVCASARLYSLSFPLRVLYSRLSSTRTRAVIYPSLLSASPASSIDRIKIVGQRRRQPPRFLARVCAASFPAGPRACMDDTRARADEDIALDSCRLRSSARLGIAASTAAAAVAATAVAASTTTSTTSSTVAATCRVARRKRKKRRRQRLPTSNDDATGVAVATRSSTTPSGNAAVAESIAADADAVVVLEPDADAAVANVATAGLSDSVAARVDKSRSRASEQHAAAVSGPEVQLRVGGSGTRAAAASSVGTAGVTLLNRRAGKRSPRRCNAAGGRRSAMTMDLQRLISEVHARPAIWDQKNVNYHNRDVILKMWREIARACEVSSEYSRCALDEWWYDSFLPLFLCLSIHVFALVNTFVYVLCAHV